MDLTCTSRVSVQIAGSKEWRLYPISSTEDIKWKEVRELYIVSIITTHILHVTYCLYEIIILPAKKAHDIMYYTFQAIFDGKYSSSYTFHV